jgi:DNA-directed RNA polymerase subunit E'/Rpb7
MISKKYEGQCDVDGYIRIGSTRIISYSSGILKGSDVIFEVVFECLVCNPVEGMLIDCQVKNITKAGIRADVPEGPDEISPVVIFVARDHHVNSSYFASIQSGQNIKIRVIGSRFELNDKYVSVIAELVEEKYKFTKKQISENIQISSASGFSKTMKIIPKKKTIIKPLTSIISEEPAEPVEAEEIKLSAPGLQEDIEKQEIEKTAQVEEVQPSFKPASINVNLPEINVQDNVEKVLSPEMPIPLPEPVVEPVIATTTQKRTIKRKPILKIKE